MTTSDSLPINLNYEFLFNILFYLLNFILIVFTQYMIFYINKRYYNI